jgi:phospholipase/lecithinase/hemolysin
MIDEAVLGRRAKFRFWNKRQRNPVLHGLFTRAVLITRGAQKQFPISYLQLILHRRFWILLVLAVCQAGSAAQFSSMYVFGDSLSAVTGGGTQYPPPNGTSADNYFQGRFSNGKVWVEYLAAEQGIPFNTNNDYSNFGDSSLEVYQNIIYGNYYPPPDIGTSLYILWASCSDCFVLAAFDGTNSWSADINQALSSISNVVQVFYQQGVRTLILPNSVDISAVPFFTYTATNLTGGTNDPIPDLLVYRARVQEYNSALATQLPQWRAACPGLTLIAPDFYSQFNFLLSHPGVYGLTQESIDALEDTALPDKSFTGPGANYVFWDYLHPTTKVHQYVADFVQTIATPPRITQFVRAGATYRFELAGLPLGRTGRLESNTNLLSAGGWATRASIAVTGATQTISISTNGLPAPCFFRLSFPP